MKSNICILIALLSFLSCKIYSDELIPFLYNGKYGYVNDSLKVVIEPKYFNAGHFTENGYAIVFYSDISKKNLIGGIINKNGEVVFESISKQIIHVFEDIYAFEVSPTSESIIIRLRDKKIIAKQAGVSGQASKDGFILAVFPYDEKRYQFIDFEGVKVFPNLNMKRPSSSFFEQRAIITNENWDPLIIDLDGNTVGNIQFNCIGQKYSESLVPAQSVNGVTGYINLSGEFEFAVPFIVSKGPGGFPEATSFSGGNAAIQTNDKPSVWNIINKQGQIVSKDIFVTQISEFSSGLSLVSVYNNEKNENRYGYINTRGEFFVEPLLEKGDAFRSGYARIVYNGKEGLLKTNGKVIWSSKIITGVIVEEDLRN